MARTVLVTGGAQGFGAAIANAFEKEGDNVAIADLEFSTFTRTGACLRGPCDVRMRSSVSDFVNRTIAEFGALDVLVNNVGIYPMQHFEEITEEDWQRVFSTNIGSVFRLSQVCIPYMKARSWGRIVNITSNTFFMGTPHLTHYVASKGAIIGLSRSLATELGPHGITVNCVAPNFTRTKGTAIIEQAIPDIVDMTIASQAVPRVSRPHDIVGSVIFLASDAAEFLTGQTLVVDGGGVKH